MFALIQLARWYGLDPSSALQGTNQRFVERFSLVEEKCERPLSDYPVEELEEIWQQAKEMLAKKKGDT
jgi:XTP/dITP diphosphohydrolase